MSTAVSFGQSHETLASIFNSSSDPEDLMSSAIIGFGAIGQALARAFARKNIQVAVASRPAPEATAAQARAIGPTVICKARS